MQRESILSEDRLLKIGFKNKKCDGYSGADNWQGLDFWIYESTDGQKIVFRGTPSDLKLVGYFNSRIRNIGDIQDIVRIIIGETIPIETL